MFTFIEKAATNREEIPLSLIKKEKGKFSLLNSCFHLYHDVRWNWVHLMGGLCVFSNFSHQLSFSWSRSLKFTFFTNTCK